MFKEIFKNKIFKIGAIVTGIIGIILIAVIVFVQISKQTEKEIAEDLYQYHDSVRFDYSGDKTIVYDEEEKGALMKYADESEQLDATPLYYTNEDTIVLPLSMVHFDVNSKKLRRMDFHTEVSNVNGNVIASRDDKLEIVKSGFAYDGVNTYIFFEDMSIKTKDETIDVSPMSYAVVTFNDKLKLFVYENEEFYTKNIESSDFVATAKSGYEIDMNSDIVVLEDGTELLIFTNPELLDPLV